MSQPDRSSKDHLTGFDTDPDDDAVKAAAEGKLPEPAPGAAGESAPGEPSRAEIQAMRPDLADSVGGTPTVEDDPEGLDAQDPLRHELAEERGTDLNTASPARTQGPDEREPDRSRERRGA